MKDSVLIALVALVVAVFFGGIALVVGVRIRRRVFAGPARDDWNLARKDLSSVDQLRVVLATSFYRPVGRGRLALPQLVYTRYAQDTAVRTPMKRTSFRVGFAALFLVIAAVEAADGVASHGNALRFVGAGCWLVIAALFGLVMPRVVRRAPVKMKRLRREIRERYPEDWA